MCLNINDCKARIQKRIKDLETYKKKISESKKDRSLFIRKKQRQQKLKLTI